MAFWSSDFKGRIYYFQCFWVQTKRQRSGKDRIEAHVGGLGTLLDLCHGSKIVDLDRDLRCPTNRMTMCMIGRVFDSENLNRKIRVGNGLMHDFELFILEFRIWIKVSTFMPDLDLGLLWYGTFGRSLSTWAGCHAWGQFLGIIPQFKFRSTPGTQIWYVLHPNYKIVWN